MLQFGYGQEDITPNRGVSLMGYLNPRPNVGVLDRLYVRTAVFSDGKELAALALYDLCLLPRKLCRRIEEAIAAAGLPVAGKTLISCIHTHTGPAVCEIFGEGQVDEAYIDEMIAKTVMALRHAVANLAPAELLSTRTTCDHLAFNRRYKMKNGQTATNPGKCNPDVVGPEGGIDPTIPILAVKQEGALRLIVANISNHTDTIGGNLVSADWPGRMEKKIQEELGTDVPVMAIIAPQGNINHFDITTKADQTNYAEAVRIGEAYAAVVLAALYKLEPVPVERISVAVTEFEAPYFQVTDAEYAEAKAVYEANKDAAMEPGADITSEDIVKGTPYVLKYFAEAVLKCRDHAIQGQRFEKMLAIGFDRAIGIVSIPAEPFIEIGEGIRKDSPFQMTVLAALGMGEVGYVGMPWHYGHGGYETAPAPGKADRTLGPVFIDTAVKLLKQVVK